ncbi:MAG: tetraacyldisaccharide 4'-kinase [Acidobacteriota bacterium]
MSVLSPAGWLYSRVINLRNSFYDRDVFTSHPLGARTISIGNITAGGTGKTPLVAHVASHLAETGETVCILTRGYGRKNPKERVLVSDRNTVLVDARKGGDEPLELATRLQGKTVVIADADRVAAAKWAVEKFGITAFVLDDAFQHRRAKRDLDIVCIDAMNPFGNGEVLPAGILREPIKNLARADAIVITRCNLVQDLTALRKQIAECAGEATIFESSNTISGFREISEFGESETSGKKALAFCAIGNPSNFFKQLSRDGFDLVSKKPFPDHHYYSQEDIGKLEKRARNTQAEILLTTAKDAVKLAGFEFEMPCYAVEGEMSLDDADAFHELISS